jgi:hypothetical protein
MDVFTKLSLLVAVATLASGCASGPNYHDRNIVLHTKPACDGGTDCEAWSFAVTCQANSCQLEDAPDITVKNSQAGPTKLIFRLPSTISGLQFDPNTGIQFDDTGFECKPHEGKGLAFRCIDKAGKTSIFSRGYKYTVNVVRNGKPLDPLDPWVVNR